MSSENSAFLIVQPKQRDGSLACRFDERPGTDRRYRRCRYVMDEDAIQEKLRTGRALKERDIRMACLIVQSFRNMMDMIDQQSPAVIEALLDFAEEMQEPDSPARKDRYAVRTALIQYFERALRQSRAREDQLFYGITGFEDSETS